MGHVESCYGPFGDSVSIGATKVHGLRRMYHRDRKSFWTLPMVPLGYVGHIESCFGPFEDGVSVGLR